VQRSISRSTCPGVVLASRLVLVRPTETAVGSREVTGRMQFRGMLELSLLGTFARVELSFPGAKLSFPGAKVPWNFRSLELSLLGAKVPWIFRSLELSFPGTFAPMSEKVSLQFR